MADISNQLALDARQAQTLQRLANFFDQETGNLDSLKRLLDTWEAMSKLGAVGRILIALTVATASVVAITTQLWSMFHGQTK